MNKKWWEGDPAEHYWLEVTRREDPGANLNAPQTKEDGSSFWSYELIKEIQPGDVVFHYDGKRKEIAARSRAVGGSWADQVVWAARGSSARALQIAPHERPGWYLGLESYEPLASPVTLGQVRGAAPKLSAELTHLQRAHRTCSLYFPFELSPTRPPRPMQGYLFKLPAFFVRQFSMDRGVENLANGNRIGADYRRPSEADAVGGRDPFLCDPSLMERGTKAHVSTQNKLADFLRGRGLKPLSPGPIDPQFDVGWWAGETLWVSEVKSLTNANEEKQLRLGLGQVLRYRQILSSRAPTKAALVLEREPVDGSWKELCYGLGVFLAWPGGWSALGT